MATRTFKRIGGEATVETKVNLGALERSLNGQADNSEDEGGEGRARDEGAAPPYKLGRCMRWKGRKQTTGVTMEVDILSARFTAIVE